MLDLSSQLSDIPAVRGRAPLPSHEYVKGWGVFGLPFDSGHVLALTVTFDIEPLAAFWDTDEETLRHGVATVLGRIAHAPEVTVAGFATNARRRLALNSTSETVRVFYLATAQKPASIRPYRGLVGGEPNATS